MQLLMQRIGARRPAVVHYAGGELPQLGHHVTYRGHRYLVVDIEHRVVRSAVQRVIVYVTRDD